MNAYLKNIGTERAFSKICSYCTCQEGCHTEVRKELFTYGSYLNTLKELYLLKEKVVLKEKNVFKREMMIQAWLLYKGYNRDRIIEVRTNGSQVENTGDR